MNAKPRLVLLVTLALLFSGCHGFVSGVRDYYTKPGGTHSPPPPPRENHYDQTGRYIGYTQKRGNRYNHYDETGRWVGHSEEKGGGK